MPYRYAKSAIKKHCYQVRVRNTQANEAVDTENQLKALANNIDDFDIVALVNGEDGSGITAPSKVYTMDSTLGAMPILLSNAGNGTVDGQILIMKCTAYVSAITITDENSVVKTIAQAEDILIFQWNNSNSKWEFYFQSATGAVNTKPFYIQIGEVEEKANVKTSPGEDTNVGGCDSVSTSEIVEFLINDLQVSEANYLYLRELMDADNIDLIFYDPQYPLATQFLLDVPLIALLESEDNGYNKIVLSGKKELGNADNCHFMFNPA